MATNTTAGKGQRATIAEWSPNIAYTRGQTVTYDGHKWTAREWNQNSVPGGPAGVWDDNGPYPWGSTTIAEWSPNIAYTRGQTVTYNGHKWTAREWNQNSVPGGPAGVWDDNGPYPWGRASIAEWSPNIAYTRGQTVTYDGHKWTAREWNQNSVPGGPAGVWDDNGPYPWGVSSIAPWNRTVAYTAGQSVTYAGHMWTAKWWTQGDVPGGAAGVWIDNGPC